MLPNRDEMMRSAQGVQPEDILSYLPGTVESIAKQAGLSPKMVNALLVKLRRMGLAHNETEPREYWYPASLQKGGGQMHT